METKKIALACFIGGVICCAVALAVAPNLWWFGILAGFAGGYVGYEFREVYKTAHIVLRKAGGTSWRVVSEWVWEVRAFFSKPHPFGYLGVLMSLLVFVVLISTAKTWNWGWFAKLIINPEAMVLMILLYFVPISICCRAILILVAIIGLDKRVMGWTDNPKKVGAYGWHDGKIVLLNYADAFRWLGRGIARIILLLIWDIWVSITTLTWLILKLIHSEKRVLCGVDSAIGGAVSYLWFSSTGHPILVVLFGGLIGAALGVLNWEIVSKRVLKVGVKQV